MTAFQRKRGQLFPCYENRVKTSLRNSKTRARSDPGRAATYDLQNLQFEGKGKESADECSKGRAAREYGSAVIGRGEEEICWRSAEGSGMKEKRDVACTRLPVSWMPVKFPEYYSVRSSPPRDAKASGLAVREDRPGDVFTVVLV